MKNVIGIVSVFIVCLFSFIPAFSQGLVDSLAQDESKIVEAIAAYPDEMRAAILNVSQYPQTLVKLERIQVRTSQSFQDIIADYPRDEQNKFYQAARFPDFVAQLTGISVSGSSQNISEETQKQIRDLVATYPRELKKMSEIYQHSQAALKKLTIQYPDQVQKDFEKVVAAPDVMSLLTDNINIVISLGDRYKNDTEKITQQLVKLNTQLTEQSAKDLSDYKNAVEKDPKLQQEMKKAAEEFAQQYDHGDSTQTYVANTTYGSNPYPYWFGYPYWYSNPMWYSYPFYYQTGFYYGPGGALSIIGMPSLFYSNWFFGFGYSRYPGLYGYYNNYYNIHRTNISNHNVYRGFNTEARNHFAGINSAGRTGTRSNVSSQRYFTGNMNSDRTNRPANFNRINMHLNQLNVRPGGFNQNSFNHFNSGSFHSGGWQHIGGGGFGGGRGRR